MRIAYICSDPGVPVCGVKGASVHVRELSGALRRLGNDVAIFATRRGGESPPTSEPIFDLGTDPLDETLVDHLRADPSAGRAVARDVRSALSAASLRYRALPVLREFQPDFVYERHSLFGTAGATLARALDVPLIVEVNAPLSQEQERHRDLAYAVTARAIERTVLQSADHVVAVSSALEQWLVGSGVEPDRITVLPNAVDPARFAHDRAGREAVRARLRLSNARVVGFLGTLKPWHDVAGLVRAVALLAGGRAAPIHLLVVGDGPERERLERLAANEGIAAATTFTGSVPHGDVGSYVSVFDVAVVPYPSGEKGSYFSPLKLFECLAGGRPVVAADAGDIRHCIRHRETGLLYPPGDTKALAAGLRALLDEPDWARSLAEAGREHVLAHHTWEGNGRLLMELAEDTLRQTRAEAFV